MAGRIKDGIVLHPLVAGAILTALVAIGLSVRAELNWQHDQILVLSTLKTEADKERERDKAEAATKDALRASTDEAWRTKLATELAVVKAEQARIERGRARRTAE